MVEVEPLEFTDGAAWESWLEAHHSSETEAWLRIGKKNASIGLVSIGDALDGALCFGWIDGHRRGLDDVSFLQRYSPRRKRSSWSQVNVAKVEALIAADRMRPPGLADVSWAQTDGRWQAAYESQRTAETPTDLAAALAADPVAAAVFEGLGKTERYAVILPLLKARSPESRAKLVAQSVAKLASSGACE